MVILGYRAEFGDSKGAHELLRAHPAIEDSARDLTVLTDNAANSPAGVSAAPFWRGTPVEKFFVLIKTFPDPGASRPGMVFSEAIFFPLNELIILDSLAPVLAAFPPTVEDALLSRGLDITIKLESAEGVAEDRSSAIEVLCALLRNTSALPVVWLGRKGFEPMLVGLWSMLPPELRKTFAFRFSFVPGTFERYPPTLVYTPQETISRWVEYEKTGPSASGSTCASYVASYFTGDREGEEVERFITSTGVRPTEWQHFRMIDEAVVYLEKIRSGSISNSEFRGLLSRIAILSPDEYIGLAYKKELIDLFLKRSERASAFDDVFALNSFDLAPFPESEKTFSKYIRSWIEKNFWKLNIAEAKQLLARSSSAGENSSWASAVEKAVDLMVNEMSPVHAGKLWSWMVKDEEVFALVKPALMRSDNLTVFTDACPESLPKELGQQVREFAVSVNDFVLHAVAASASMSAKEAIDEQIKVETSPKENSATGFVVIAERSTIDDLLSKALSSDDDRLFPLLAPKLVGDRKKLKEIDLKSDRWQMLVESMLESDEAGFWEGLEDPRTFVYNVFDLLHDGSIYRTKILKYIGQSEYADLSHYDKESTVWQHIPAPIRDTFLDASADGWWADFDHFAGSGDVVSATLLDRVDESERIERHLSSSSAPGSDLLRIVQLFPRIMEHDFDQYLEVVLGNETKMKKAVAVSLGKFVNENAWKHTARIIFDHVDRNGRMDLRPALRECLDMFGFIERFYHSTLWNLSNSKFSFDEWFSEFADFLFRHYPNGPSSRNLWRRAGGDESVLINFRVTGRDAWIHALDLLRSGGANTEISTTSIIEQIMNDLPHNDEIRILRDAFFAMGGTR